MTFLVIRHNLLDDYTNDRGIMHSRFIITTLLIISFSACVLVSANPARAATVNLARFERAKEHFRRGVIFFNNNQYLAAVEFFRKAIAEYPEYHTAREYLARSYKLSGYVDEALKEWESLAAITPDNVSLQGKIDTLRYRQMGGESSFQPGHFVLSTEYSSAAMKRFRFPQPTDVTVDREKNVYITSFSGGKLIKIDTNGHGVTTYSPSFESRLYGIDYFKEQLAVSDFKKDSVYIMTTAFKTLQNFGSPGNGEGHFHGPKGLCFDEKGYLYVVDSGNSRVQKFDNKGNFILQFGQQGEYEGQFSNPTDVTVYKDQVFVTDTGNRRIVSFDDSGNFIKNYTQEKLEKPRSIAHYRDHLLVSDEFGGLLFYNLFNNASQWFSHWDNEKRSFSKLFSATFDRDGYLYCLDYNHETVFLFSPLQSAYTNLEVEITAFDTAKFPVVAVYLNVKSRTGKPIYGLNKGNFRITEDGSNIASLYVDYLKSMQTSLSMVLCTDRSVENQPFHKEIPWAAEFILSRMRKNDSLKVLNFNEDYWTGNPFDWSRRRALRALEKKEYAPGKNIGNVLYNALNDLVPRVNRRAVILITDGSVSETSFSKYSPQYIIEYARNHYIPVYIIAFKEKNPVLEKIATETGGALYKAGEIDKLKNLYETMKGSEERRYVLVYYSFKLPSFKGWWSDVKLEVDYKGQTGHEWGGYFVP